MILQANIGGYSGRSASAFADLDLEDHTLYVEVIDKLKTQRYITEDGEEAGVISNQIDDDFDYFFSEDDFKEAFQAFRNYEKNGRLVLSNDTKRASPRVEFGKISNTGTEFLIDPDITNEQMAVIALCFFAHKASNAAIAEEMNENVNTQIFSI